MMILANHVLGAVALLATAAQATAPVFVLSTAEYVGPSLQNELNMLTIIQLRFILGEKAQFTR